MMTRARTTISNDDIGRLLRLIHQLHDAPNNPVLRHERMLQGLCALAQADAGASALLDLSAPQRPAVQFVVYAHHPQESQFSAPQSPMIRFDDADPALRRLLRRLRTASPRALTVGGVLSTDGRFVPSARSGKRGRRQGGGGNHALLSAMLLPQASTSTSTATLICLHRRARGSVGVAFHRGQREMVQLFHSEAGWLYRDSHRDGSGSAVRDAGRGGTRLAQLSSRQRQTLDCLLSGHSEKQIAGKLGLSPHTVHIHVKAIYRVYGVSSRAELLSKFVRWPER